MIAAALQLAAALSLACSGTLRTGPLGQALPEAEGEPFTITYRIDLEAGRWCADACATTEPVADVAEGRILLRDHHHPAGSHVVVLDPATGRFTDTRIEGNVATLRSGRCEGAAISEFGGRVA